MNWPGERRGRVLACGYVAGFAATLIGLLLILVSQISGRSGPQVVVGGVVFLAGQVGVYAVAFMLRDELPAHAGRSTQDRAGVVWNRLMMGRELRAAVRVLRG